VSLPEISVVIPALNEQAALERALSSTRVPGVERIVVDGGSTDGTPESAQSLGAEQVVRTGPGRARQLQAGYEVAKAPVILFLHADTHLEAGWDTEVRRSLADPRVAGGVFELHFESPRPIYRWVERGVRLRCRIARLPYGDQGLFVRRAVLEASGGIPETPIFEDLDLVRTVRNAGRLVFLPVRAWTSARRYERNGPLRTVGHNTLGLAAYLLRLDRERVSRWHRRKPMR
jgi:rSAM/selenodomain-associated transferase 2